MTKQTSIAFIGGGNMARSMIGGMLQHGHPAAMIGVSDPLQTTREQLKADFAVTVSADNTAVAAGADVLVLAVKPQQMQKVVSAMGEALTDKLVISIAAGIRSADLQRWADRPLALVRCMPNTPALLQSGATALFANQAVSHDQREIAGNVISSIGIVAWLETEEQLDAITALSGSGPAYFFLLIEAMIEAAIEQGIARELATEFAVQTALGAARMAGESKDSPAQLRNNVTSPGGTTEAALKSFVDDAFFDVVRRAMQAASARSGELGDELGAA